MIRRLLWTLLVLIAALMLIVRCASAQTPCAAWCVASIGVSAPTVAVGSSVTVSPSFTSSVAATGVTLGIEIHDPTGARVAYSLQPQVNFTAGQTVPVAVLVWTVPAGQAPGTYIIALGVFLADGSNPYWNAAAATFTVTAPITSNPGPVCLPKIQIPWAVSYGQIPAGVSTRYTYYGTWLCSTPSGYLAQSFQTALDLNTELEILQYIASALTPGAAAALITAGIDSTPLTATEQAFSDAQLAAVQPTILVALNGMTATRQVYTANADGTLNPTPVPGELIAVANPCDARSQIAGTQYFSVAGAPNVSGGTFPAGSFAICVITAFPYGVN